MWLRSLTDRFRLRGLPPKDLGRRGEDLAVAALEKRGYEIIERNYRCRLGEIDVVARQGPEIVFLEVKTRRTAGFGEPQDAVTAAKARRLINLGHTYIAEKGLRDPQWRIDVVAVWMGDEGAPRIDIIRHAVEG